MRIAIIGAGFSGLSSAWHLLQSADCEVTLFDPSGIGGGASGIAAGLLHPYVGEEGKRSLLAKEGIESTRELIAIAEKKLGKKVARQNGIVRHVLDDELKELFLSHAQKFGDVRQIEEKLFLIESGMTVDCPSYLEGLWQAVAARGGKLVLSEVEDLSSLQGFDHIIVAAGAGIAKFAELKSLRYSILKGQVLICRAPKAVELPENSSIGKGYVALPSDDRVCHIGSTYERGEKNPAPDQALAMSTLFPKIRQFFPAVEDLEVIGCKAAMRVIRSGHYFPIAAKIKEGLWVLTGMGSRGLLYHAFLGRLLSEAILTGDDSALSFLSNNKTVN
ncbi:MAG: FAD-binding oxidoreductase [Verrucomicrobia bacterium]|nr:FAD-binding oxidoreductase [Verrucomicrobiota bacterium]